MITLRYWFMLLTLLLLMATPLVPQENATSVFRETFDGKPSSPQPWHPSYWDIHYHSRDVGTWEKPEAMDGHHGPDCAPAPASHRIRTWRDSTYVCIDHGHTAVSAGGYGAIYLTPNHMVDFSQGEAVIRWSNSTLITSNRDWVDVWITPYEENLALPLTDWLPDLQGEPRRSIQVTMDFGQPRWFVNVIENHQVQRVAQLDWPSAVQQSHTDRTPLELRISRNRIRFGMPEYNVWTTANLTGLSFSRGVVQFGHHSYNPTKDGGKPNSWGWDDIEMQPTIPFRMDRVSPRILSADGRLEFAAPAPEGARLRFAAVCNVELNFGAGFAPASRQPEEVHRPEHFSSYFVPVPAGATYAEVRFRGDGWYSGFPCAAKDAMVWSPAGDATTAPPPVPPPVAPPAPPTPPTNPEPSARTPRGTWRICRGEQPCIERPVRPVPVRPQ